MTIPPSLIRPNFPKPKPDPIDFFQKAFSTARIGKYFEFVSSTKETTDKDIKKAMRLYEINMIYCECFYPSLHTLEIALRNYIDISLINKYSLNWFICNNDYFEYSISKIKNRRNIDIIIPNNNITILLNYEEEKIVSAINDTMKNIFKKSGEKYTGNQCFKITDNRDEIIANLSLGFWTALLTHNKYRNIVFGACYKSIFPNANKECTHDNVSNILKDIKDFRNRVFHHEPIWYYHNLKDIYDNIYKFINWIDPNLEIWLRQDSKIDRFPEIYENLSQEIKILTEKNTTKKIQYEDRSYA
ncbi:MAG: hypothetical protein HEQ26_15980 [Dolichospermum sp. DL01]|nr:MAG: hypothetical protein HEQ26_15980 [Dolichospermum sp. DL01]